jgi:ligand-binding SRPBCC domain-containing protein
MTTHIFTTSMTLPLPRKEVFAFFAEAGNLERITPPELQFRILTPQPIVIQEGTLIDYQLSLFGVPMKWQTLIARWEPDDVFEDRQLRGPYKRWEHTHWFYDHGNTTEIEDVVRYEVPFGPLGMAFHPLVRLQIQRIFAHREKAVCEALVGR